MIKIPKNSVLINEADKKQTEDNFFQCAKQGAINRIRNYSGQELKGKELFEQLGVDYA